ncbi:DnaJ domain-containing protein, partial [Phenylobacterium sp.]|uniref:DnaJ domain-containing protein n=1 Tax=Phenylobacterium sp. TaxID=1871053 RepID=UPI0019B8FDF7
AAFAAAAFLAVRGGWVFAPVLIVIGRWLAMSTRGQGVAAGKPAASRSGMSVEDACAILGVEADAEPEEIQAAYTRLMRRTHPDAGGSAGLAAQLNAARDRLLKG